MNLSSKAATVRDRWLMSAARSTPTINMYDCCPNNRIGCLINRLGIAILLPVLSFFPYVELVAKGVNNVLVIIKCVLGCHSIIFMINSLYESLYQNQMLSMNIGRGQLIHQRG